MKHFRRDYNRSAVQEREAIRRLFVRDGVTVIHKQDEFNYYRVHYDFKTNDRVTFEFKADFESARTGNVFVEYQDRRNPSGINITTADFHIFMTAGEFYQIPTAILKELVKGYRTASAKDKDTGELTWGYLVPRQVFINASVLLPAV